MPAVPPAPADVAASRAAKKPAPKPKPKKRAMKRKKAAAAAEAAMPVDVIEALILERDAARGRKDFDAADGFRNTLRAAGIKVDDRNGEWASKDGRSGAQLPGGGFTTTTGKAKKKEAKAKAKAIAAAAAHADSSASRGASSGASSEANSDSAQLSDYGAWEGYGLDEVLLKSLRRLGFSSPTTVQSMCLSASIAGELI